MIRAVFFDAVGTLIEPWPSAIEVYEEMGRRHGSSLARSEIASRFRSAFRREDDIDRQAHWQTSEEREQRRWRHIVAAVLDDVKDGEACFRALWQHFARPEAWHCLEGADPVLAELERRGYTLGMASNFDSRLRSVAGGLMELRPVRSLIISSESGWRKPAAQFFERVVNAARVSAEEVLFVGDDPLNDGEGSRAAGMGVALLGGERGPACLADLLALLPGMSGSMPIS